MHISTQENQRVSNGEGESSFAAIWIPDEGGLVTSTQKRLASVENKIHTDEEWLKSGGW